jgi:processing peptidase subunit beta
MFGNLPNQAPQGFEPFLEPARFTGSDVLHRDDSYDTCSIALAYPTAGITDPDNITLMVIQTLLGSWERSATAGAGQHSSSRMVSDLALGGSARSVNTFNTQYKDTGLFGIHLVAEDVHTHESVDVIQDALATLSHKVDEAHLQEAKTMLKMNLLSQQDGTTNIAEDIGRQMLAYGRRMHPLELVARIDAVDANAVKNVARRYFYDQDHALAAVGNTYELQSYERIRRKSYWLRY